MEFAGVASLKKSDNFYILTVTTLMEVNTLLKLIKERINSNDMYKNIYITISSKYTIDICINECNKGLALKKYCDDINIQKENIYAFGDSFNDLEMLNFAGNGIVMKNGCQELKSYFGSITDFDNNDDGVARYLEKLKF